MHGRQSSSKPSSQLGWSVGRNLKIETRQIGGNINNLRRYAAELVALAPDVILSVGSITVAPLQQATRCTPNGVCERCRIRRCWLREKLAHPGGNITGFSNLEYSMSGKSARCSSRLRPT